MTSILKVDNLQNANGSNLINESGSIVTIGANGNTVALAAGATQTGFGGVMTPAFEANIGSTQNVSSGVVTKAQFNTEAFDTNNCYDNTTNYRFTPTTAGKYFVYLILTMYHPSNNNVQDVTIYLYKNGSAVKSANLGNYASYSFQTITLTIGAVINFNGSTDYVEAYGIIYGNATLSIGSGINNVFGAYKLIGV